MSIFKNVWSAIKHAVDSIINHLPKDVKDSADLAVQIVQKIRTFDINNLVSEEAFWTHVLEGVNFVDAEKIKAALPDLFRDLQLTHDCSESGTPVIICAVKTLLSLAADSQKPFLHGLSITLGGVLSDGKLSWSDGAKVIQWVYEKLFK